MLLMVTLTGQLSEEEGAKEREDAVAEMRVGGLAERCCGVDGLVTHGKGGGLVREAVRRDGRFMT